MLEKECMKKIILSTMICSLASAYLYATTKDHWEIDARVTTLLQRVVKLQHPFYRPTFDTLIQQTLQALTEKETHIKQSPFDEEVKHVLRRKEEFLASLLKDKVYYSCMTDTDMSDVS